MKRLWRKFLNLFRKKSQQSTVNNVPQVQQSTVNSQQPREDKFKFKVGDVGVDISHHNKEVDIERLSNNVDFIYMKATEGVTFVSDAYEQRSEELKRVNNVPWGAYHYYRVDNDPVKQAEHFCKYIYKEQELPPVLDIEEYGNKRYVWKKHTADLLVFLQTVEEMTGKTPMVYTSFFYARDVLRTQQFEQFSKYPLWLAWYRKDFNGVKIPAPWTECKIWQHTEYGRIKGVEGRVDLNLVMS